MVSWITIVPLLFLVFTTFYHSGEARSFVVGGSHGWKIPQSPNDTLNHWAESDRFKVGDVLVFNYDAKIDSVLQVTKENYESCNIEKPLKEYKGGNNNVTLDVSGPHYFISGAHGNCGKGEKLIVVVQSTRHPQPATPPPAAPAKPPTNTTTQPPPPATPSKPPTTSPSPPPKATPSKPPTSPPVTPSSNTPAPAPAPNAAVGLVAGNGIFWAVVAVIGLAWA